MIKKIFKGLLKFIVGILLLIGIAYGGFHLVEYATGGKYIDYLTENSETISIDENFSFDIMEDDLNKSSLILAGEIHGFKAPQQFDLAFFKYLHKNHGVKHYFAELDFIQASFLNVYLESGDDLLLQLILKKWVVVQGRNNKDYFDKYRQLHQYYQQLPETNKFQFVGIDKVQDLSLISSYLNGLDTSAMEEVSNTQNIDSLLIQIDSLEKHYSNSTDTLFKLSVVKDNLHSFQSNEGRETVLFNNFAKLYKHFNLAKGKAYGYFGLYHVFQYRINNQHPLASQIRKADLGLEDKILSLNFMMNDSYMVMPSNQLPEFMREKGNYTRMPVSADNMLFMYIYGIKDFKRMTPEHHQSLIKMNAENSPYANSSRLNTVIQLLPVTDLFDMTDEGKPYVQYTVFIRNSDWAEPMNN